MTQTRRYRSSGEVFACDPTTMTMSEMLPQEEQDGPLEDYQLDHEMTAEDLQNSVIIRGFTR